MNSSETSSKTSIDSFDSSNEALDVSTLASTRDGIKCGYPTMVIGHRGGYFGPENSMLCFRRAMEQGVEGIEFDVSKFFIRESFLI